MQGLGDYEGDFYHHAIRLLYPLNEFYKLAVTLNRNKSIVNDVLLHVLLATGDWQDKAGLSFIERNFVAEDSKAPRLSLRPRKLGGLPAYQPAWGSDTMSNSFHETEDWERRYFGGEI